MKLGILGLRKTIRAANLISPLRMTGVGLVLVMYSVGAWAATYYVSSSTGNDTNSGSLSAPWQTVAHVNGQTFQPGDSILFKRGDVWNESLVPASSGSSGNPITFDAYGTSAAPNLTGYYAVPSTAWQPVSGNAWKAWLPPTYATVNFCLFGSIWGQRQTVFSTSSLTAQWDFYFANGYLYVFSAGNPSSYYSGPIVPMALSNVPVINVNGQSWLTFQHFLLNWFDQYGVYVQGSSDHLVFANMEADSMIPQGTQPLGFYVNESVQPSDIKLYNDEVYEGVRGWESFEPWLSRIEKMEEDVVWSLAGEIPPEWYGGEWDELEKLVRTLIVRRGAVRELIEAFRVSPRRPFPGWLEQA